MRTITGKMIGQSGPELLSAVLFSSVLHVLVFTCAFILFGMSIPRKFVPPAYQVTLVSEQPGNLPKLPEASSTAPVKPVEEHKPPQKAAKPAAKAAKPAAKGKKPAPKGAPPKKPSKR